MTGSIAAFRKWLNETGVGLVLDLAALRDHQKAIEGLPWWEESAELGAPGDFSLQMVAGLDRLAALMLAALAEVEVLRAARADAAWPAIRTPSEVAEDIDPKVIAAVFEKSEKPHG
jgi:hypothetical protein